MKFARVILSAPIATGILVIAGSLAYAAGTGYTSGTGSSPAGTPGGFTQVVTAQTVPANTSTVTTIRVTVGNTPATLSIPPATFSQPVQVVVTKPVLSQVTSSLPSLGFTGYTALAGLGINVVTTSGQTYPGNFQKPVTLTVTNPSIKAGDKVLEWNAQGSLSTVTSANVTNGSASWSFQQDPSFVVVAPTSTVPGATSPVTGKPFAADIAAGLGLTALGSGVLIRLRRHKSLS